MDIVTSGARAPVCVVSACPWTATVTSTRATPPSVLVGGR